MMKKISSSFLLGAGLLVASSLHAAKKMCNASTQTVKKKDAVTQTEKKQEIVQEIKQFLASTQREAIKQPFINTMFNKVDMIKTISDQAVQEKILQHFESIEFNKDVFFHFLPKQKTPKIYTAIERLLQETITSHAAIFFTKTDGFEVFHDKQHSCCLILLPEKIITKLSDEMLEQALYAHVVLSHPNLAYNKLEEKIEGWFNTIKTIGLVTLCSLGALAGIWFFPKLIFKIPSIVLPLTLATFTILSDYWNKKEKKLKHAQEHEADQTSALIQNKNNTLQFVQEDIARVKNTFDDYQKEHVLLQQKINELKQQHPDQAKKLEQEALESFNAKKELMEQCGEGFTHPSYKKRLAALQQL